ncbi:MAG: carbon-nitrogen family hydrolase [Thermobacillus sp.]|uniref:Putative amidohydrolase n=1 Tax=Thermobacillus composti (strain DSM 18247 / JCM 13945 / KWC4) TaxID=717605 RepID=L0EDQ3_THECK|nr:MULTISPECIES: carbon-nitrogen family hydrolase [Thermobacillus]AGA57927.1 putative amidohydrolase [Thermobacillus composti KWC4]REK56860.1 MAG: carbon-nitrogen family hydrolase [Thermobacillus sp.]
MGRKMRISLVQMHVDAGSPEANFGRAAERMEQAAADKPDLIVLPEMWNTGYALEVIGTIADPAGERTKAFASDFSRRHGVNVIAGSIAERREDGVYNTIRIFGRDGEPAGEYDKIHLFRLMDEEKHLRPGQRIGLAEIDGVRAGVMICYDIRFPELARTLALAGARLLVVPAEWPHPRLEHWRTLLRARAIENQMYVAACNRVGSSNGTDFSGHSMIIDPWGEIVAEAGEEETILTAEIDLELVEDVRRRIPVFEDRRPALYKLDAGQPV